MPETARILAFPAPRRAEPMSPQEAREEARCYLERGSDERNVEETNRYLSEPEILSAVCRLLRDVWNSKPDFVVAEASFLYSWLSSFEGGSFLFDERDYLLGETALLTAGGYRLLGNGEQTERWLARAESGYRHTVNPAPLLAEVAYMRLALWYDRRRYEDVLELLPSTLKSFEKLGMRADVSKARFLEAMTLKECSRNGEAFSKFTALKRSLSEETDTGLLGQVLIETGAYYCADGDYAEATADYRRALSLLNAAGRPAAVAHLQMTLGGTLRLQGMLPSAVEAFREAIRRYDELGMETSLAYCRVILAETLLSVSRPREAEWEILAALPTIEEQKMVPEGFAAVALLKESVRRRRTDPKALRRLRDHLQANKA
jgi:tetratricopeptide (TPR) repeat protein